MILDKEMVKLPKYGAPRTSGDDPINRLIELGAVRCSPHERG